MCLDHIVINSFIDNVLSGQEALLVKDHLESCPKCSNLFNSYDVVVSTIHNLPQPEVSIDFLDNLFLKINSNTHPAFEELSSYYDKTLTETTSAKIKEHLVICSQCQEQLNNISVISSSVSCIDNFQVSPVFFDNLIAKIDNLIIDNLAETSLNEDTEIYQAEPDFINGLMSRIEGLSENSVEVKQANCISSEDLSAYLDNEQTGIPDSEIDEHLEICAKCKSKYFSFKISRESVLNLQQSEVPFNFSRKVLDDINQKENKIIKFLPFVRKNAHRASMVAGIIIAGILVTMSRAIVIQPDVSQTAANITIKSEDFLFSPASSSYRTDSIEVLADNSQDTSLDIQDIGL